MSSPSSLGERPRRLQPAAQALRVAMIGPGVWLDGCFPAGPRARLKPRRFAVPGDRAADSVVEDLERFRPDVSIVLDPVSLPAAALEALPGTSLGVLVSGLPPEDRGDVGRLDRLVAFTPALTGEAVGDGAVWRAIPPPVSDLLYGEPRRPRRAPRAMSIGASSDHRETVLLPAKHHYDVLQLIHGVSGEPLREVLAEYDVGIFVPPHAGGGFGHQVGVHLAAGQLLLSEPLAPAHGLERNIDYLQFDQPHVLTWLLERLSRFPEMHQSIRVRGRLKAEQYRASRIFARILNDLLLDVATFGPGPAVA